MASVQEHYDTHLGPHYAWISGGSAAPLERFAALLRTLALSPSRPGATALDLGAGNGFQSLPLAAAGYAVTAIDLSQVLLAELARDAAVANLSASVHTIHGDLRDLAHLLSVSALAPELIVCMGDTLPHLPSRDEVAQLLATAATALAPGGHLLLSFRDYTTARTGADRFIPVRSEADRLFTCFLDYAADRIAVHDIVHTRDGGAWRTAISVYEKLRLPPDWVRAELLAAGLALTHDSTTAGLLTFAARRPLLGN